MINREKRIPKIWQQSGAVCLAAALALLALSGCGRNGAPSPDADGSGEKFVSVSRKEERTEADLSERGYLRTEEETTEEKEWEAPRTLFTTDTVKIRSGPGMDWEVLDLAETGTAVSAVGPEEDGWIPVDYNGRVAYISSMYLTDRIPETTSAADTSPVAGMRIAQSVDQMILVSGNGTRMTLSMYEKQDDRWAEVLTGSGFVGTAGVGESREGSEKTPVGVYSLTFAFGILDNPGTSLPYVKVDSSHYWVDDPASAYYNQFVSTRDVEPDWDSAEHLIEVVPDYDYAIAVDYNSECTPGAGSAIVLHVSVGRPTEGCISVPEEIMIRILREIRPGCVIVIDEGDQVYRY